MSRVKNKIFEKTESLDISVTLIFYQPDEDVTGFLSKLAILLRVDLTHLGNVDRVVQQPGEPDVKYIVSVYSCRAHKISLYQKEEILKRLLTAIEIIQFSDLVFDCCLGKACDRRKFEVFS